MIAAAIRIVPVLIFAMLALATPATWAQPVVWHVNDDAPGPGEDGETWNTAFRDLQDGLDAAGSGDEVWVAGGVYTPTDNPAEIDVSFEMRQGVEILGGFNPGADSITDRRPHINITILSGDLGGTHSRHVVTTESGIGHSARLSGFVITGGMAIGEGLDDQCGAGLYIVDAQPVIDHCVFVDNIALRGGGACISFTPPPAPNETPVFANCIFLRNSATGIDPLDPLVGSGGGVYVDGDNTISPRFQNCVFNGNSAMSNGGAVLNYRAEKPFFDNCTFTHNTAAGLAGGLYVASGEPDVNNSILWGNQDKNGSDTTGSQVTGSFDANYSCITAYTEGNNIGIDPKFRDPDGVDGTPGNEDDELYLLLVPGEPDESSPCIDSGNNNLLPDDFTDVNDNGSTTETLPWDLDRDPRIMQTTVDRGAYEFSTCPHLGDFDENGEVDAGDLADLLGHWGKCRNPDCPWDLDGDGDVDPADLAILLGNWGDCGGTSQSPIWGNQSLNLALGILGFDGVDEFIDWSLAAPPAEVYVTAMQLLELLE